jgi:hypothetical protein
MRDLGGDGCFYILYVDWKIETENNDITTVESAVFEFYLVVFSSLSCLLLVKVKLHICELFDTREDPGITNIPGKKKSHPSGQTVTVIRIHCRTRFAQVAFLLPGYGCIFILLPPTSFTFSSSSATNNLAQSLHLLLILDHPSSSLARMTPSPSPSPSPSTTSSTRLDPLAAPWMKRATDSPVLRPCSSTTNSSIRNVTAGLDVQRVDLVDTRSGAALLSPPKHPLLLLALLLLQLSGCWLSAKPTPAVLLAAVAHTPSSASARAAASAGRAGAG